MDKKVADHILKGVESTYGEIASDFSRTRGGSWPEMNEIVQYISKGSRVLDLGCGNGRFFSFLKEKLGEIEYVGLDVSSEFIEICKERYGEDDLKPQFVVGDMRKLDFKDEEFDVVVSIASFHHLPTSQYRVDALNEIHRVLQSDGRFVMTNWNLWQPKYARRVIRQIVRNIFLGDKYDFGDVFIPWALKDRVMMRYYHAFTLREIERLVTHSKMHLEKQFYYPKSKTTNILNARNICTVLKK